MKTYHLKSLSLIEKNNLLKRPAVNLEEVFNIVKPILND